MKRWKYKLKVESKEEFKIELEKEKKQLNEDFTAEKDEVVKLEIDLSDNRASLLKLQEDYAVSQHELKQVLLCVQQYYVECEVLKKGVLQLGGESTLDQLLSSSQEAVTQLYSTKPSQSEESP